MASISSPGLNQSQGLGNISESRLSVSQVRGGRDIRQLFAQESGEPVERLPGQAPGTVEEARSQLSRRDQAGAQFTASRRQAIGAENEAALASSLNSITFSNIQRSQNRAFRSERGGAGQTSTGVRNRPQIQSADDSENTVRPRIRRFEDSGRQARLDQAQRFSLGGNQTGSLERRENVGPLNRGKSEVQSLQTLRATRHTGQNRIGTTPTGGDGQRSRLLSRESINDRASQSQVRQNTIGKSVDISA